MLAPNVWKRMSGRRGGSWDRACKGLASTRIGLVAISLSTYLGKWQLMGTYHSLPPENPIALRVLHSVTQQGDHHPISRKGVGQGASQELAMAQTQSPFIVTEIR